MQRAIGFAVICLTVLVVLITVKIYGKYRDCRDKHASSIVECLKGSHFRLAP
jgi:hypothetical protein